MLQYRKRYELLQPVNFDIEQFKKYRGYNTASGMSCCNQYMKLNREMKSLLLQYRKRYELLQQVSHLHSSLQS